MQGCEGDASVTCAAALVALPGGRVRWLAGPPPPRLGQGRPAPLQNSPWSPSSAPPQLPPSPLPPCRFLLGDPAGVLGSGPCHRAPCPRPVHVPLRRWTALCSPLGLLRVRRGPGGRQLFRVCWPRLTICGLQTSPLPREGEDRGPGGDARDPGMPRSSTTFIKYLLCAHLLRPGAKRGLGPGQLRQCPPQLLAARLWSGQLTPPCLAQKCRKEG